MLYLIGVNHGIQRPFRYELDEFEYYSDEEKKIFFGYIENQVAKLNNISFIAEEFSEDAKKHKLPKFSINFTLLENLTKNIELEHIFIDPSIEERKIIGIPSREEIKITLDIRGVVYKDSAEDNQIKEEQRKYDPIRENFWVYKIKPKLNNNENGLVIIGSDHIKTFPILLESKNIHNKIIEKSWHYL